MQEGKNIHFSPVDSKPLCSFSAKLCKLRRLNGYAFCVRHILEDSSAPFKRCEFVVKSTGHRCSAAIPLDEERTYCHSHMQVLGLLPKKERKSKKSAAAAVAESLDSDDPEAGGIASVHEDRDDYYQPQSPPGGSERCSGGGDLLPAERFLVPSPNGASPRDAESEGHPAAEVHAHLKASVTIAVKRRVPRLSGRSPSSGRGLRAALLLSCRSQPAEPLNGMYAVLASMRRYDVDIDCENRGSSASAPRSSAGEPSLHRAAGLPRWHRPEAVLSAEHPLAEDHRVVGAVESTSSPLLLSPPSSCADPGLSATLGRLRAERQRGASAAAALERYTRLLIKCARSSCSATATALLCAAGGTKRRLRLLCNGSFAAATSDSRAGSVQKRPSRLPISRKLSNRSQQSDVSAMLRADRFGELDPDQDQLGINRRAAGLESRAFADLLDDTGSATNDPSLSLLPSNYDSFTSSASEVVVAPAQVTSSGETCRRSVLYDKLSGPTSLIPCTTGFMQHQQHQPVALLTDAAPVDVTLLSSISKAMLELPIDPTEASGILDDNEIQQVLSKLPDETFSLFNGKTNGRDFDGKTGILNGHARANVVPSLSMDASFKLPDSSNISCISMQQHLVDNIELNNAAYIRSAYASHAVCETQAEFSVGGFYNPGILHRTMHLNATSCLASRSFACPGYAHSIRPTPLMLYPQLSNYSHSAIQMYGLGAGQAFPQNSCQVQRQPCTWDGSFQTLSHQQVYNP